MPYEIVLGLEIHLKLNSPNKLFCQCKNEQEFDDLVANTNVCPVCMGQPGALPVLNKEPLEKAILLGVALNCHINEISLFDRKSYFYPDLPMGYQITQQQKPTCVDGEMQFYVDTEFTQTATVRIRDAHIEVDTGKSIREGNKVLLDYNRSGTPLVEIVTHPDFRSADEVVAFLKELQRIARFQGISDADMEKGQMRVDVNISLMPIGETTFGTRVELKNMNSFSAVTRAIEHEYTRQAGLYDTGTPFSQETRMRDDSKSVSVVMRSKEDAMDYRYMPEPDLPPLDLDVHRVDAIRAQRVDSPFERIQRYKEQYSFNKEYVNGVLYDTQVNSRFEASVAAGLDPKVVATWIVGPILRVLNEQQRSVEALPFSVAQFQAFLRLVQDGSLIASHAKLVMQEMLQTGSDPQTIIEQHGFKPVDGGQVSVWIDEVFAAKPELLEELKSGNMKGIGFAIGQVVQKSGGAADPKMVKEEIEKRSKN